MMNRKGQALVLFVLIIPLLLGIMALTIDISKVLTTKNKIQNVQNFVLTYELNQEDYTTEEIQKLLDYNLYGLDSNVLIKNEKIEITTTCYIESIFSKLFGFNIYKITNTTTGYKENDHIIIN